MFQNILKIAFKYYKYNYIKKLLMFYINKKQITNS